MLSGLSSMMRRSLSRGRRSLSRGRNSAQGCQRNSAPQLRQRRNWSDGYDIEDRSWSFADDDDVVPARTCSTPMVAQAEPEASVQGPLVVQTRVEYTALPRGRTQDVFGLVTIEAKAPVVDAGATTTERKPVDVVCVLDVSGSMTGAKLQLVQDAVRFVVSEMRPEDRLSLVQFNDEAQRPLRLRRMAEAGKDEAIRETAKLVAGGGTSIASGLNAALAVMEQRQHRNPVSAVLLLTDGQDCTSAQQLTSLVDRARGASCALYAFGFGADHDAGLLSSLAEQAQTPFSFIEDVEHIRAAFAGTMGGLVSVAAQNVQVNLECRCTLKAVHTPFPSHCNSATNATVQIPDMLAGERRDILVELTVAEASDATETVLLTASAKYWDLHRCFASQTAAVVMVAQRLEDEAQPELEPDVEVVAQRCRFEVTQVLGQARQHGDAGRFQEAQAVLSEGQTRLRASPQTEVGAALELELDEARDRLQDHSNWEDGGRAELADMCQMHRMQRATNVCKSSKSRVNRCSKAMYTNSVQKEWLASSER